MKQDTKEYIKLILCLASEVAIITVFLITILLISRGKEPRVIDGDCRPTSMCKEECQPGYECRTFVDPLGYSPTFSSCEPIE